MMKRLPAWCDRVLFRADTTSEPSCARIDPLRWSTWDHRPVT